MLCRNISVAESIQPRLERARWICLPGSSHDPRGHEEEANTIMRAFVSLDVRVPIAAISRFASWSSAPGSRRRKPPCAGPICRERAEDHSRGRSCDPLPAFDVYLTRVVIGVVPRVSLLSAVDVDLARSAASITVPPENRYRLNLTTYRDHPTWRDRHSQEQGSLRDASPYVHRMSDQLVGRRTQWRMRRSFLFRCTRES